MSRKRIATKRWGFTGVELAHLAGFYGVVALLHALGWGFFLYYSNDLGPVYAGAGALAYTLGMRHAFDADHISAIDDTIRFLLQKGKRPLGVGFFFSLGHSSVVLGLSVAIALAAQSVAQRIDGFSDVGGLIGATVSATFLWIVGILNLIVLLGLIRIWRDMKRGAYDGDQLEELLLQRGLMNRLLGGRFRRFVNSSWHMYPVGVLFGLGFDTASQVGLLALSATAASGVGGVDQVPFLGIIALPLLFAAGMSLMDTTDGVFMSRAYSWAFTNPVRKMYYNFTTTGLSVFVALLVGTIEYIQVVSEKFHVENDFVTFLGQLNFQTLGYIIVGAFLVTWIGSAALFKLRRVDERYARLIVK